MGKEIIKGWVVMFAENVIERMCATDNGIIFTPYCIFRTRQEAKDWINEKWIGGYQGSNCLQKPYNIHRNRLKTLAFYY